MNKTDLTDVTFLIPVRIVSKERFENFILVLKYLNKFFKLTVTVLEADKSEKLQNPLID